MSYLFRALAALVLLLAPGAAMAQQSSVLSTGLPLKGHVGVWQSGGFNGIDPVLADAGTVGKPNPSAYITDLPVVGVGDRICIYDALITSSVGYHSLCFGANKNGSAVIEIGSGGGATAIPLELVVNGVSYEVPFVGAGSGNVVGPNTSAIDDFALWNNTNGTALKSVAPKDVWTKLGLPKIINVRNYGAVGDGSTSDDTAIAAAVAAVGNNSILYFPASSGCYVVNTASPFTISASAFVIMGDGEVVSSICKVKKTGDLFTLTGANWINVRNLTITGTGYPGSLASYTSGYAIDFTGAGGEFFVDHVSLSYMFGGIKFNSASAAVGHANNITGGGLVDRHIWWAAFGGGGAATNVTIFGTYPYIAAEANETCIEINSGDTYWLHNVNCGFSGFGIKIITGAATIANVFATNVLADLSQTGDGWSINGFGGTLARVYLTNSWGSSNQGNGLHALYTNDLHLTDFHGMTNVQRGVYIDAFVLGLKIEGGEFGGNSATVPLTYDDIQILPGTQDFTIHGITSGLIPTLLQTGRYALHVDDGASNLYQIVGNKLVAGGGAGGLYDGGTGGQRVVHDNLGVDNIIPTLASANSLYLGTGDNPIYFVSGVTTIKSIFIGTSGAVVGWGGQTITIIPTGVFTLGDGTGNVGSAAIVAVVNVPIVCVSDTTNWRCK